jgi:hypothetical protein
LALPPGPTGRQPWSRRRKQLLLGLAAGAVVFGAVGLLVRNPMGVTAAFLAALCGFLLVVAVIVFVAIPGPNTLGTLLRTTPLAGAVLVVTVLLAFSNPGGGSLRAVWIVVGLGAAAWTAFAAWETHRSEG